MEAELFESFYDSMSERDKYRMVNKLWKHDEIGATKLVNELHALRPKPVPVYNIGDVVRCLDCGYTWGESSGVILAVGVRCVYVTMDTTEGISTEFNTSQGYCHAFDEIEHMEADDERDTD